MNIDARGSAHGTVTGMMSREAARQELYRQDSRDQAISQREKTEAGGEAWKKKRRANERSWQSGFGQKQAKAYYQEEPGDHEQL